MLVGSLDILWPMGATDVRTAPIGSSSMIEGMEGNHVTRLFIGPSSAEQPIGTKDTQSAGRMQRRSEEDRKRES